MRIGITGGIGSGKTVVSNILTANQFLVFNSDTEAKKIINTNPKVQQEIVELFGFMAFQNGVYNTPYIADRIFKESALKERLNTIIHPQVRAKFNQLASIHKVVFNEAAILFETGSYKEFDKMILVTAPESIRIARVHKRDGSTEQAIKARMASQWPDVEKIKLADYCVVNDGKQSILEQLNQILKDLGLL